MKLHERWDVVLRAKRQIEQGFDDLYPEGAVIERMCTDVCRVEILCLRASDYEHIPPDPWQPSTRKLWHVVRLAVEEHGLTWGEAARIVHHLSDYWLNVILRIERHGDREDAHADLAYEGEV